MVALDDPYEEANAEPDEGDTQWYPESGCVGEASLAEIGADACDVGRSSKLADIEDDTQLYLDFSGGAVEMANTLDLEDESIALHNDQAICMESEAVASETQTIKYDSYSQ